MSLLALLGFFGIVKEKQSTVLCPSSPRFEAAPCCIIKDECVLTCGSVSSF